MKRVKITKQCKGKKKKKKKKNEKRRKRALRAYAESRGQGCYLPVRSVLPYVQLMDQHKEVKRRPDGRQQVKKRLKTNTLVANNNKQKTSNPMTSWWAKDDTTETQRGQRQRAKRS